MSQRKNRCPDCGTLRIHSEWCPLSRERKFVARQVDKLIERLRDPMTVPPEWLHDASRYRTHFVVMWLKTRLLSPELASELSDAITGPRFKAPGHCRFQRVPGAQRSDACTSLRQMGHRLPLCAYCALNVSTGVEHLTTPINA